MSDLIDIRCPLPRKDGSGKLCNRLAVRVRPGSSGEAYCLRDEKAFDFQVDDFKAFNGILETEKPLESAQSAKAEHPANQT